MADSTHLEFLRSGVPAWNRFRADLPDLKPDLSLGRLSRLDLSGANLRRCNLAGAHLNSSVLDGADLSRANLSNTSLLRTQIRNATLVEANLAGANLTSAVFTKSDLSYADLSSVHGSQVEMREAVLNGVNLSRGNFFEADLQSADIQASRFLWANLTRVNLKDAVLRRCDLTGVSLIDADASGADFQSANLSYARIIDSRLDGANLSDCRIYGISAWNVISNGAVQADLIISPPDEPRITVDDLDIAQFVYVLLHSPGVRRAITALTSKVVLILGRFTPERMQVLQAIRDALRSRGHLPILFDFATPSSRDLTETISTLAHLSRFVIADITDARSIPQELMAIVPNLPSVPVQPLLLEAQREYGMFEHFGRYPWVLSTFLYKDTEHLLSNLDANVIAPAELRTS